MEMYRLTPAVVRLSGVVQRQTFPGYPNYQSIEQGDRPETYWILHLAEPIQVENGYNTGSTPTITCDRLQLILSGTNQSESSYKGSTGNIRQDVNSILAMFIEAAQATQAEYDKHQDLVGATVIVTGNLIQAHTAHHNTPVLITVRDIIRA